MVVLGFLLVVVAVLAGLAVGISSGSSASIEGFGVALETTAAVVYFAGAATALVLLIGLWLMMKGSARTYRRRQEVRSLRRQVGTGATPAAGTEPAATDEARHAAGPDDVPPQENKPSSAPADDGGRPATTR